MFSRFKDGSKRFYFAVCAAGLFFIVAKADEITDNTVSLLFGDVTIGSWNSNERTGKFKVVMTTVANGYCPENLDLCGLKRWNQTRAFQTTDVTLSSGSPKQQDANVLLHFHITLPDGSDNRNSSTVVPKDVLEHMIKMNRTQISAAVGVAMVTESSKKDDTLNYIMIPVSFGLLFIVCMTACSLHFYHKRKISGRRRKRKSELEMKRKTTTSQALSLDTNQGAKPDPEMPEDARNGLGSQSPQGHRNEAQSPQSDRSVKTSSPLGYRSYAKSHSPQGDREEKMYSPQGDRRENMHSPQGDRGKMAHSPQGDRIGEVMSPTRMNATQRRSRKNSDRDEGASANEGYEKEDGEEHECSCSEEQSPGLQGWPAPQDDNGHQFKKKRRHKKRLVSPVEPAKPDSPDVRDVPPDVLPSRLPPIKRLPPISELRGEKPRQPTHL